MSAVKIKAARISIHALREEGDILTNLQDYRAADFYPRPPRGGRRNVFRSCRGELSISIHALREEGDGVALADGHIYGQISIHALREEGD